VFFEIRKRDFPSPSPSKKRFLAKKKRIVKRAGTPSAFGRVRVVFVEALRS